MAIFNWFNRNNIKEQKQQEVIEEEVVDKKESPRFILKSTGEIDTVKGIGVEMDWNDEFIEYLQELGTVGHSEEEIVQKWLVILNESMIMDLEEEILDNNTENAGREFE